MGNVEADVVDFLRRAPEAVVEGLHYLNVGKPLRLRSGIVARTWNRGRQDIQARRGQRVRPDNGYSGSVCHQFGARPPDGAAHHVPDDYSVNALFAGDDFRAQARMDAGPCVVTRVRAGVRANAPDDELVGVRGSLEDVGVVAVKTALQLDDGGSA